MQYIGDLQTADNETIATGIHFKLDEEDPSAITGIFDIEGPGAPDLMDQGSYRISLADGTTGTIMIRKLIIYPGGRGIFASFVVSGGLSNKGT